MNKDYLHNFACWAAARAVQRNFTTTENIVNAIEKSGLRDFVETYNGNGKAEFEAFHIKCGLKIIEELTEHNCTYGIAAKIIAVYIKTALVIPLHGVNCEVIYPPIDAHNLSKIKGFSKYKWTKLDKETFDKIIGALKSQLGNSSFIDFEAQNTFITNKKSK